MEPSKFKVQGYLSFLLYLHNRVELRVKLYLYMSIGVGRFRILGGPRFRIFWGGQGGGGQIPSRHMKSKRRRCDVTTSHRRHFDVVCPLGF